MKLHKTFSILLPDLDAFVPPGDAHDYLIKAKVCQRCARASKPKSPFR